MTPRQQQQQRTQRLSNSMDWQPTSRPHKIRSHRVPPVARRTGEGDKTSLTRAEMSGERKLTTAVSMAAGSVWYSYMQRWACTCNAGGCVAHVKARGPAKDRHRHAGRVSTGSMDQRPPGASPRGQKRKSGHGGESDEGACKYRQADWTRGRKGREPVQASPVQSDPALSGRAQTRGAERWEAGMTSRRGPAVLVQESTMMSVDGGDGREPRVSGRRRRHQRRQRRCCSDSLCKSSTVHTNGASRCRPCSLVGRAEASGAALPVRGAARCQACQDCEAAEPAVSTNRRSAADPKRPQTQGGPTEAASPAAVAVPFGLLAGEFPHSRLWRTFDKGWTRLCTNKVVTCTQALGRAAYRNECRPGPERHRGQEPISESQSEIRIRNSFTCLLSFSLLLCASLISFLGRVQCSGSTASSS